MDLRSYVNMEVKKSDRTYHFFMPIGAPYGEAYDAAFETLVSITDMAKQARENARPKDKVEDKEAKPLEKKK